MNHRTCILLCLLLPLCACGKSDHQPAPEMFKQQIDTLDKAKAVDPAQQQQDEQQRKAIEQQTQ